MLLFVKFLKLTLEIFFAFCHTETTKVSLKHPAKQRYPCSDLSIHPFLVGVGNVIGGWGTVIEARMISPPFRIGSDAYGGQDGGQDGGQAKNTKTNMRWRDLFGVR
jgi:hypothetical protein